MRFTHIFSLTALTTTALLAACNGAGDESPTEGPETLCKEMLGTDSSPVCVMEGTYLEDWTLTRDMSYLLSGGVFIGDDERETILTVEPGVTVYGETSSKAFLTIRRGSKLMAEGTREAPIVFTSAAAVGARARGDWGGIILNGRSTLNICDGSGADVCTAEGEGGTGTYGGDDEDDDSGVIKWVRVEFAGNQISSENELNGIAFQAVGRGTTVDYVQVHMGADDGVEFFGGTVNARHILVTGPGDDGLDWTYGWRGKLQFAVVQQYATGGDQGIEADNYDLNNTAAPVAQPWISNVTLIGSPASSASDIGVLLREGTGGHLSNLIVTGFNEACLDVTGEATFDQIDAGTLTFTDSILWCDAGYVIEEGDGVDVGGWYEGQSGNTVEDPMLVSPFDAGAPVFSPGAASPALGRGVVPADAFFTTVDYLGGVDPDDDWTTGWTTAAPN